MKQLAASPFCLLWSTNYDPNRADLEPSSPHLENSGKDHNDDHKCRDKF